MLTRLIVMIVSDCLMSAMNLAVLVLLGFPEIAAVYCLMI